MQYIEKQEAIDIIGHELHCCATVDQCGLETAFDLLCEIPPVDVRPVVRGEWVYGKEIGREYLADECVATNYKYMKCSVCNTQYKPYVGKFNFCPNCGSYNGGVM